MIFIFIAVYIENLEFTSLPLIPIQSHKPSWAALVLNTVCPLGSPPVYDQPPDFTGWLPYLPFLGSRPNTGLTSLVNMGWLYSPLSAEKQREQVSRERYTDEADTQEKYHRRTQSSFWIPELKSFATM